MTHKNLGPKTGSFEPPSYNDYKKERVFKKINDTLCADLENVTDRYHSLFNLMTDFVVAYERGDDKKIKILIKEYRKL